MATTITVPPSTTATDDGSAAASTSTDIPLYLWGQAASLLSSYYPSASIGDLATFTWPSTVVIDGKTYDVSSVASSSVAIGGTTYNANSAPAGLTTAAASASPSASGSESGSILALPTSEPSASTTLSTEGASSSSTDAAGAAGNDNPSGKVDRRVAIAVGIVVTVAALAMMGFLFWCLRRRKRATGSYFNGRANSVSDSEIGAWRHSRPEMIANNNDNIEHGGPSQEWVDRYNRSSEYRTPPISKHPAFAGAYMHQESSSDSENPFFTPEERSAAAASKQNSQSTSSHHSPAELAHDAETTRRSASTTRHSESDNTDRPPTPFSPMMMMMGNKAHQPVRHENPFSSPEDSEADDIVSPIVPAKHPQRRHSPNVHYPSWSEMSEFNFTDDERSGNELGRSARDQSSGSDGGDGWRPLRARESVVGRHELA